MYAERQQQQQQQQQMQLNQQQIEAEAREKELQRQHELAIEDKKGQYRVLQEKIQAAGRAADAKSDATSLNYLAAVSDQAVRQADIESKENIETQKIESNTRAHEDEMRLKMEELKLRSKELAQRAREDATKRYVAGINKN